MAGLLHHSDRGSQYASDDYQRLLAAHGIRCSMSRKGDCYDNAVAESFFGSLKRERVHHERYQTRGQARADLFEYIEVFYNQKRLHSSAGLHGSSRVRCEIESGSTLCPLNQGKFRLRLSSKTDQQSDHTDCAHPKEAMKKPRAE